MKQTRCSYFLETDCKTLTVAPVVQQFAGIPRLGMRELDGGILVPVWTGAWRWWVRVGAPEPGEERRGTACLSAEEEGTEDRLGQSPKAGQPTEHGQIVKDVITCV